MLVRPPMSPLLEATVVLIGLLLTAAALGTLGSVVVRRLANPVGAYRVLYGVVLLPAAVLAYVLLAFVDLGPAVLAAVGIPPTAPPAGVLTDLIELLAVGLVSLAAYAPTVRGVATVRELELSTWRALRRMARFVAVVCVVVTIAAAPLRLATPALTPVLVAAGLGVVGLKLSRRGFQAADAYAADRLGVPAVAAALERHADGHGIEPTRRRVPNPLAVNVPLGDRLDRLRRGASA